MKFLVLLLIFILQRKLNLTISRQHDQWARRFLTCFESLLPVIRHHVTLYVLIAIILPALALLLLLSLVEGLFFGMGTLFLHIVILFLCLGCGYVSQAMELYLSQWEAGSYQSAFRVLENAEMFIQGAETMTPAEIHYHACLQFMYRTFQCYFMVIFWYMVGGPVGALVARLAHVAGSKSRLYAPSQMVVIYQILEWLPVRLLGLTFALVGNFSATLKNALNLLIDPSTHPLPLLQAAAAGAVECYPERPVRGEADALRDSRQMIGLRDMLNRAVMVWFSLIAILTIVGWMS